MRLKNALNGRAWTMCHKKDDITASKLSATAAKDAGGPDKATRMLIECVRKACEKAAPLKKRDAFEEFFRRGARAPAESIQDFIARRETEYEKMTALSPDTTVSEDLRTFFMLSLASISDEQHRAVLGQCQNDYKWDAITSAMLVQFDNVHLQAARYRTSHYGQPQSGYEDSVMPSDSVSQVPAYTASASSSLTTAALRDLEEEDAATVEALTADVEEFDVALGDLDIEKLEQAEVEAFALEAQKLHRKSGPRHGKPSYRAARDKLAQGKVNRGWRPSTGVNGSVNVDSREMSDKLTMLK